MAYLFRRAVTIAATLCFVATYAEAKPPSRLKSKSSMLDGELDDLTGGEIEKEAKAADKSIDYLKKTQSPEAMAKRHAEEEKKRREAEAAKKAAAKKAAEKKKAEAEAKKRAEAEAAKKKAAARRAKTAAKVPAKTVETENVAGRAVMPAVGSKQFASIKDEANQRRKNRATRKKTQQAEVRAALGKKKASPAYVAELKAHSRRRARLRRIQEVAATVGDAKAVKRASDALVREDARHTKQLAKLGVQP